MNEPKPMPDPEKTASRRVAAGLPAAQPENLKEHYAALARAVRLELWRYDLNKQELRVASVLLELSLGMERDWVRIDRLRVFCDLTGLDRANVSRALACLARMRIVRHRKVPEQELMEYSIEADSDAWRCQPLQTGEKLIETLEWVAMLNRPAPASVQLVEDHEFPPDWDA